MSTESVPSPGKTEFFSLPLFVFTAGVSLCGCALLLRWLAPESVWDVQVTASVWQYLSVFLIMHMFLCFVEFVFHRYVLHRPVLPFLSVYYRAHTLHHSLTRIGSRRTPGGKEILFVENKYPITEPHQGESAFFPWYTIGIFAVIFTPLFATLQWLMPSLPWFGGGLLALTASVALYEIFHAIEHFPFEKWAPLLESPRMGWFWRKVYGFHLRHHAAIHSNEAISGFFTLPVADWVFGTAVFPKTLYKDGEAWVSEHFANPRPFWPIRQADRFADWIVKMRRARVSEGS